MNINELPVVQFTNCSPNVRFVYSPAYNMVINLVLELWMQFCKNIVLAGVGSLTLNDDNPVTEEALAANFLIPFDENMGGGGSLAELCCDSLKDFNPMVHVSVAKGMLNVCYTNIMIS